MRAQMALSLPRHPSTVACARGILDVLLTATGTTDECRDELAVIITEACTNAIVHSTPSSPVDIRVSLGDGECTLEVGNRGDAINAESIGHRRGTLRTGGRGLLVIAALVDTMALPPAPPGQVLIRITKHLPDGTAAPNR